MAYVTSIMTSRGIIKFETLPKNRERVKMRELFEICPKIQFFSTFLVLFEIRGGGGGIWSERCKMKCSDVSWTTWKFPYLSPGK